MTLPDEIVEVRRQLEAANERARRAEAALTQGRDPQDALEAGLAELDRQYGSDVPSMMNSSTCRHVEGGAVCGMRYKDARNELTHAGLNHSFLPFDKPVASRAASYTLTALERAKLEGDQKQEPVAEAYLSVQQAALMLSVTPAKVRAMVKSRGLRADTVGKVILVRRESVDRLLALAELSSDEPEPIVEVTEAEIVAGLERAMESARERSA